MVKPIVLEDICEHVSICQLRVPIIEVYKCSKPDGCEKAINFSDFYVCRKVYEIEQEEDLF